MLVTEFKFEYSIATMELHAQPTLNAFKFDLFVFRRPR